MRKLPVLMLALVLSGCGAANTPTTGLPAEQPAASPPAEVALPTPAAGAPGSDLSQTGDIEALAIKRLATTLNKPADTLKLQSKDAQEWSNSALGCPKPDMMYAEMIVPGYKLTFSDGTKTYEVHTDQSGNSAVLCEAGKPTELGGQ